MIETASNRRGKRASHFAVEPNLHTLSSKTKISSPPPALKVKSLRLSTASSSTHATTESATKLADPSSACGVTELAASSSACATTELTVPSVMPSSTRAATELACCRAPPPAARPPKRRPELRLYRHRAHRHALP
jgi:hypothetical protein